MKLFMIICAVLVGATPMIQAGLNATIARFYGHPAYAALTNTLLASLVLAVAIIVLRLPAPDFSRLASAPWWSWGGGAIGAILVFSAIVLAPRLGAASYASALVVGGMMASIILDHFGLIGYREQPLSTLRLTGAAMVVVGMLVVQSN